MSEERACSLIRNNLARREKTCDEVTRAVQKVRGFKPAAIGRQNSRATKIDYDPEQLAKYASRVPFEVTHDWLAEVSPEYVLDVSPAEFLTALYKPGEHVCIIDLPNAKKSTIWTYGDAADSLDRFRTGKDNVWFQCQPVNGTEIDGSWRAAPNVTAWRYGVLESDEKHIVDLWLRAIVQLRLPIAAIYTSGGKSVHALFRVDADTKDEWDSIVRRGENNIMSQLVRIGADPGALKAVQLTRLPGCFRGETNQLQRLLYLNPDPEKRPIYAKARYT